MITGESHRQLRDTTVVWLFVFLDTCDLLHRISLQTKDSDHYRRLLKDFHSVVLYSGEIHKETMILQFFCSC